MVAIFYFTIDPVQKISIDFCWNILDNFTNIDRIPPKKYNIYIYIFKIF